MAAPSYATILRQSRAGDNYPVATHGATTKVNENDVNDKVDNNSVMLVGCTRDEISHRPRVSGADFFDREPELRILENRVVGDAHARIAEILDLLVHDGYLEAAGEDHEFPSRLLKDWWAARFRAHHVPIADRSSDAAERRTR